jgi:uncharacterized protein (DUF885 family)
VLDRRNVLLSAGATLALAGTASARAAEGPEAQLNKAMDDFFAQALVNSPELATSLGLDKGAMAASKSKLH